MIRPVKSADAGDIRRIYNHYVENTTVTFEEAPVSEAEMGKRIEAVTGAYPWLVHEKDGRVTGYAYAGKWMARSAYRFAVETSVYVDRSFHGRGIGGGLYAALLEDLKSRNVHAVIGIIALPNDASRGLHEKQGFKPIGLFPEVGFKFNAWIDVEYWELLWK